MIALLALLGVIAGWASALAIEVMLVLALVGLAAWEFEPLRSPRTLSP